MCMPWQAKKPPEDLSKEGICGIRQVPFAHVEKTETACDGGFFVYCYSANVVSI
ncbi:hypothetical protein GCM10017044_28530 [Kordiimonas sediminis]|uniref:Uncharacterized protein n=1 Tax=Kordiimonas sediminis TaxID=1735581 RepID=A0A919AXL2_9PROT|nr:hypothetical protein GCM10017044_28530 [Kordiimonas sediminis]